MKQNNNTVLAFSGGCFSAKSETMRRFKRVFGDDAIILSEIVRDRIKDTVFSIDDLRKKPDHYFNFQKAVIKEKIEDELKAVNENKDKVILIDRALTDSLFYYTFYVDKSNFDKLQWDKYTAFLTELIEEIEIHCLTCYDTIVEFKPIERECDDVKYRPENIDSVKYAEYQMINIYDKFFSKSIVEIDMNDVNAQDDDVQVIINKFFKKRLIKIPTSFKEYEVLLYKNYVVDDLFINKYGSIELYEELNPKCLMCAALLYSYDKSHIDEIINDIKQIDCDLKDSLCYPTGLLKQGTTMFVGEAPGQSGRGINGGLKPAFVFEKPSHILRYAIQKNIDQLEGFPYITNLCKYATKGNKINDTDFYRCFEIFKREVDLIKPKQIICLGNKVYDYISSHAYFQNYEVKKLLHPAATIYHNVDIDRYSNMLKNIL